MRQLALFSLLLVAPVVCAQTVAHELEFEQARQVALTVAEHDNIIVAAMATLAGYYEEAATLLENMR